MVAEKLTGKLSTSMNSADGHETLRAKADRLASKTGITHFVLINRYRSERPGRVIKLGNYIPTGWKIVYRAEPTSSTKDQAILDQLSAGD